MKTLNKKDYARECSMVAAIIADHILKRLYNKSQIGYIAVVDLISSWAIEFVEKHKKTNWEDVLENDTMHPISKKFQKKRIIRTRLNQKREVVPYIIGCWDDAIADFAEYKLEKM